MMKALESKFTILHKKTFKTIHVNTCKIKLTTLEGYCRPNSIAWKLGMDKYYDSGMDSGLTALRTINIETFPLTTTNCQELWKNGRTFIRLSGEDVRIDVEMGKRQEKYQQRYLHGSSLNDRYECKPDHGFSEGGNIFRGLDNQYSKKLTHEVI